MAASSNEWPSQYQIQYANNDQCMWVNLTKKDAIICKEFIQMGPGSTRVYCNTLMKICRLQEIVPVDKIKCASLCQEIITPKTRFVAICRNVGYKNSKGHYHGKKIIICKECIEKYQEMPKENRKYEVMKNCFH